MRAYASVKPRFWTGETGRQLRGDSDAQLVALYLITSPHANMIGAYYLPLTYLAHETGLAPAAAEAALDRVCATGFAQYDSDSEHVWIPNLARDQVGPSIKPADKRRKGVLTALGMIASHPFAACFVERYGVAYGIALDPGNKDEEAPSKGLCPVPVLVSVPEPDSGQESAADADAARTAYEEAREGTDWRGCRKLTEGRRAAATACVAEFGLDSIRDALARARRSTFLTDPEVRNASPDHGTWRPDFDWFLRQDTLTKILEGKYDDEGTAAPQGDTPERRDACASKLSCDPAQLEFDAEADGYVLRSEVTP